jgi:DNA-binding CsgD family transcriptional regulator/PAS domain-containing protein
VARAETILAAVEAIHEAAITPDGWTRALPSVAQAARSERGLFITQDASSAAELITGFGCDRSLLAVFAAAVRADAPYRKIIRSLQAGSVVPRSALLPDREFARSTFYNEGVRPTDTFHGLMVPSLRTQQRSVYLVTGRRHGREDYDAEDIAAMRALTPHIVTALQVSRRLAEADLRAAGASAALDRLDVGVLLVDAAGQILFGNRAAEFLLDRGHCLRVDAEGLSAADPAAARALRRLIAACAGSARNGRAGGSIVDVPRGAKRAPLRLLVAPCGAQAAPVEMDWLAPARPAAIVLITDPERERGLRKETLQSRLGLTAAEADVALEIMKGDGRDATAARLGVTVATVRTHLLHIFQKTGVHRQAELVSLLLREESGID